MDHKKTNDFTVLETKRSSTRGEKIWQIILGGKAITTCVTKKQAVDLAEKLNLDPYFLNRGQTRADIIANSG
jgi:hypothetical protein